MPFEQRRVIYLSPQDDAHGALLAAAQAATSSLHLLVYGFTLADLGEVLIAAHQRGLSVGIVSDKTQAAGPKQHALLQRLVDAGIPVTITTSTQHSQIMHQKVLLVDVAGLGAMHNDSFVVYGSFNFSDSAQSQANVLITENNPALCDYFWGQYQALAAFGAAHDRQLSPTQGAPTA